MRAMAMGVWGSACAMLLLMADMTPAHADVVGLVQRLQNTVYGTPPAAARVPKYRRDGVEYRELIETAKSSAVDIGFVDGSDLTVGAEASLVIDEFVFDQATGSGSAVLNLTHGALRWITGVLPPGRVRFETPTATITVRGTNVKLGVKPNGDSIVALDEGEVTVIPKGNGEPVKLIRGQSARVTAAGVEVVDDVLPVADVIVDSGWSRATDFGRDRDHNSRESGSNN